MDTSDILDGDYGEGITLQTRDLNYLRTAGKWGRFISIASLALMALGLVFMIVGGSSAFMLAGGLFGPEAFILLPYLAILGVIVYMNILMYQFATNAVSASTGKSKSAITEALKALSRMFIIGGVLFIIYLAFTVLIALFTASAFAL